MRYFLENAVDRIVAAINGSTGLLDVASAVRATLLGSRTKIDASLDDGYRITIPILGSGDITYGTLETLSPAPAAVTVGYSSSPVQIAGDLAKRGPLIMNEDFLSSAGWVPGAGWGVGSGVATGVNASSTLSQLSKAKINGRVLIVWKMTNASGTVTPFAGTTNGTARGSAGVTNKVYSEVLQVVGNTNVGLTGAAYVGSIDWFRIFPLNAPQEPNQTYPRSFSRIAAVCYAGAPVDVSVTSGHGVWVEWLRS